MLGVIGGGSYCFFFQAEDGIRDLVRSRGLGDVYKRQYQDYAQFVAELAASGTVLAGGRQLVEGELANGYYLSLIHI